MKPVKDAPKETGYFKTLSKYDKIAVEKHYGCIKNGKRVKRKKTTKKEKCKKKGFRSLRETKRESKQRKKKKTKTKKKKTKTKKKKTKTKKKVKGVPL